MKTYLVGYDLNAPGKNYEPLLKALREGFNNWWHYLDSTWIIKTNLSAMEILTKLRQHIDNTDELLVVRLSGEGAWIGFDDKGSAWLKSELTFD